MVFCEFFWVLSLMPSVHLCFLLTHPYGTISPGVRVPWMSTTFNPSCSKSSLTQPSPKGDHLTSLEFSPPSLLPTCLVSSHTPLYLQYRSLTLCIPASTHHQHPPRRQSWSHWKVPLHHIRILSLCSLVLARSLLGQWPLAIPPGKLA